MQMLRSSKTPINQLPTLSSYGFNTYLKDIDILLGQPMLGKDLRDGKYRCNAHISGFHADNGAPDPFPDDLHALLLRAFSRRQYDESRAVTDAAGVTCSRGGLAPFGEHRLQGSKSFERDPRADGVIHRYH